MRNGPDLTRPILELAVEDWSGLWEIYHDVAAAIGAVLSEAFRKQLLLEIADMIDTGLLEGAIWSYDPPKRLSADEVRQLSVDSEFWKSPDQSRLDEQIRISATELGRRHYFGRGG